MDRCGLLRITVERRARVTPSAPPLATPSMSLRSVRLLQVSASAILLAACVRQVSHPQPLRPIVTAVYDVVIDDVYGDGRPDTILIGDSSVVFSLPTAETVPQWRAQFDSFPSGLVAELARRSAIPLPSSRLALPPSARTITSAELAEIFSSAGGRWTEFYRRYPRQRVWIRLSPVVFNQDSTQAVLYREYYCGSLCGSGDLMWLDRRNDSTWHVRKSLNHWVS